MKHNFTLMKSNNLNQFVLSTILFASIFIVACNNEQSNDAESVKTDANKVACYYCGMFPQPEEVDTSTLEGSMAEINVNSKEQVTVARQELNTIYDSLTHLMANEDPNGDYKDQEAMPRDILEEYVRNPLNHVMQDRLACRKYNI